MKRIISLVLAFVLVLSFSVTVFAVDDSFYGMVTDYLYRIDSELNTQSEYLSDIEYSTASTYSLLNYYLGDIHTAVSSSNTYLQKIYLDYFGIIQDIMQINDKMDTLVDVLADPNDVSLKESQKDNQQFIQDNFFTPGSDLSVDTNKLGALVSYSDSFNTFFNFSSYGNSSPLDQLGEGSPFSQWFTEENGKSMDPTFSAGGGGSDPDPDDPNPDDPNPDDPDPEPETTSTPTLSYNESTFTVSAAGNGTVIMYVDGVQVSNPYTFIQGDSSVTYVVTATAQEEGKLISNTARLDVTIEGEVIEPDPEPEITTMPSISYNEPTFTVSASGNGTVIMYVDGVQVSNPYTFTQGDSAVTYVVTATAQEEGKLISNTARLEVTVPKYEPPFSVTNLIPTSTSSYSGGSIYNGTGYRNGYVWGSSGSASSTSVSGWGSTGWMNCSYGDVFYIYNADVYRTNSYAVLYLYSSSGMTSIVYNSVRNPFTADSNGVISYTVADNPGGSAPTRIAFNLMSLSAGSVITKNEYPIQVSASAYSLRGRGFYNPGSNIVSSFYNSRQSVFDFLLRGGRSR